MRLSKIGLPYQQNKNRTDGSPLRASTGGDESDDGRRKNGGLLRKGKVESSGLGWSRGPWRPGNPPGGYWFVKAARLNRHDRSAGPVRGSVQGRAVRAAAFVIFRFFSRVFLSQQTVVQINRSRIKI
jgi:hypothetical protein